MSPSFDEVYGVGALRALELDLDHSVLGPCFVREFPGASFPQAPQGAAVLGFEWAAGGSAVVAASPGFWFFHWLDAGGTRGAGLVAHLALVLQDRGVTEVRCVPLDPGAASLLCHCGFQQWADGPPAERHLSARRPRDPVRTRSGNLPIKLTPGISPGQHGPAIRGLRDRVITTGPRRPAPSPEGR
jgi:hypothetical protein